MSVIKHLADVKSIPNDRIVKALETILERAKTGELRGFVCLLNLGNGVSSVAVGESGFTDVLAAFEDWKFTELFNRNIHKDE